MAAQHRVFSLTNLNTKQGITLQRRRRKQSAKIDRNIDEDVLMASAIGDVAWLQQSLYDTRKAYSVSKEHGLAPVHLAAQNGQLECLKAMIEKYKVDVNFQSASGWRPLHLAIKKSTKKRGLRCVKYLLENGADPSLPTNAGITPVHQAASDGHVKCLQELIKYGAKIDAIDANGHTPMFIARVWGHRACARILANQQWYLDKQRYLIDKLEEEQETKRVEEEMHKLSLTRIAQGKHEGQLAFQQWLGNKGIPDIATMYGPIPHEERKAVDEMRESQSLRPSPTPLVVETAKVVRSKAEFESFAGSPLFASKKSIERDHDSDKKLDLIPLESISASKLRKGQRTEGLGRNRSRMVKNASPT
ncbi:ankyrin repeat domain-containing protein 53-like [Montipora capricornis]|uniref:ankyrin repeat domain-containing protein 53-like n=1 Tax=Montipora capricornis TaxID=246305 RepID=UPI0035F0FC75